MRPLLLSFLLAATAAPLAAQVHVRGLANAGYDIGYGAPSLGAAAEAVWAPSGAPIQLALRPSADVVLTEAVPVAVTYGSDSPYVGYEGNVVRLGAEVVGRWSRSAWPVVPYLKAGVAFESVSARSGDVISPQEKADAVAGAGVSWRRLYVEGTHGFRDVSRNRLAVGVRL